MTEQQITLPDTTDLAETELYENFEQHRRDYEQKIADLREAKNPSDVITLLTSEHGERLLRRRYGDFTEDELARVADLLVEITANPNHGRAENLTGGEAALHDRIRQNFATNAFTRVILTDPRFESGIQTGNALLRELTRSAYQSDLTPEQAARRYTLMINFIHAHPETDPHQQGKIFTSHFNEDLDPATVVEDFTSLPDEAKEEVLNHVKEVFPKRYLFDSDFSDNPVVSRALLDAAGIDIKDLVRKYIADRIDREVERTEREFEMMMMHGPWGFGGFPPGFARRRNRDRGC